MSGTRLRAFPGVASADLPNWDQLTKARKQKIRDLITTAASATDLGNAETVAAALAPSNSPVTPLATVATVTPLLAPNATGADDLPVEATITPLNKARSGGCAVPTAAASIDDPDISAQFIALVDGLDSRNLSPFQVAESASQMGFRLTASIVRHHRRRLSKTGEHCSCPR